MTSTVTKSLHARCGYRLDARLALRGARTYSLRAEYVLFALAVMASDPVPENITIRRVSNADAFGVPGSEDTISDATSKRNKQPTSHRNDLIAIGSHPLPCFNGGNNVYGLCCNRFTNYFSKKI